MTSSSPSPLPLLRSDGTLPSQLAGEMCAAWARGERISAEDLLAREPSHGASSEVVVRLVCEEICLRQEHGLRVDTAEFLRQFPRCRTELEVVLGCHRLFEGDLTQPVFPAAGEEIGEFKLLAEIDRGVMGRVFLAEQPALSDRTVVVKFTAGGGAEHLSLARLQHTGIMPLYLVQDFPERNLRALCMPHLGGISLLRMLEAVAEEPIARRSGQSLVAALERAGERGSPRPPGVQLLARATYVEAICWIGACLADALHYAHQRRLVHLDVKPSNVLLAGDGQPMLLDFHLSRAPITPDDESVAWLGGTPAYMSPEQRRALEAVRAGNPVGEAIDGRSDIFSLGRLLYEALGGPTDEHQRAGAMPLRKINPLVSPGLDALLRKCLSDSPRDRYTDASLLAQDLRRHLANLPLTGVANRPGERWRKWRRRRPHALPRAAAFAAAAAILAVTGWFLIGERVRRARHALDGGRQLLAKQAYSEAIERFDTGRELLAYVPGGGALRHSLEAASARARRARLSRHLDQLLDRLRFVGGAEALPRRLARDLEAGCAEVWASRERIVGRRPGAAAADGKEPSETKLLELAVLWADLAARAAPEEGAAAARDETLRRLAEADRFFGPNAALARERLRYSTAGEAALTRSSGDDLAPRSAREHDALGRFLLRDDRMSEAADQFRRAVDLEPQAFWPNYYLGWCNYRLGNYERALNSFCVCVALAPSAAECYYNRALVHVALGENDEALRDFHQALHLRPELASRPEAKIFGPESTL